MTAEKELGSTSTNSGALDVCTMFFIQTVFDTDVDRMGCKERKSHVSDVKHLVKIQQRSDNWGAFCTILLLSALC